MVTGLRVFLTRAGSLPRPRPRPGGRPGPWPPPRGPRSPPAPADCPGCGTPQTANINSLHHIILIAEHVGMQHKSRDFDGIIGQSTSLRLCRVLSTNIG